MKTKAEVCFRKELAALLDKYDATIEVRECWTDDPEDDPDMRMIVEIPCAIGADGKLLNDSVLVDLGAVYSGVSK